MPVIVGRHTALCLVINQQAAKAVVGKVPHPHVMMGAQNTDQAWATLAHLQDRVTLLRLQIVTDEIIGRLTDIAGIAR